MSEGKSRHWLRWNWKEAVGLVVLSVLFVFVTYHGTDPEKSAFLDLHPHPDCVEYATEANRIFHGKGADLAINGHHFPSRYPLGFPLALAALHPLLGGSTNLVIASAPILFLIASMWVFYALLRHCAGTEAALAGTLFFAANPCILCLTTGLYSESLLALLTVLTVGFFIETVQTGTARAAILFGAFLGYSIIVRTQVVITVPFFAAAYFWLSNWRLKLRPVIFAVCGALPFLAAQAIAQWYQFGSPLVTGYAYHLGDLKLFSPGFLAKGLKVYVPGILLGRTTMCMAYSWVFVPVWLPLLALVGMLRVWKHGGSRTVILNLLFVGMTLAFFCCYLFTDTRFFVQVLILFFAWAGIGTAWLASRLRGPTRIAALVLIAAIVLMIPVGNRKTPYLFSALLRTTSQKSYLNLNLSNVFRALEKDSPGQPRPVLITTENLVLVNFYSDEFELYPLAKRQEYARVEKIGRRFPETIDSLLEKSRVYVVKMPVYEDFESVAFDELKEDFQLDAVPCDFYGNCHLYRVIGRIRKVPERSYWGG